MTQSFRTEPFVWEQPALYQISIRAPDARFTELSTFTFPLSPNQIRYDRPALSTYMDVQGTSKQGGVNRQIDRYGVGPPLIQIEGTTGWDRHQQDGYLLGGIQSMQLMEAFLARYTSLNQQQRETGQTRQYTLEFYDYFRLQFWQVEPVGPQTIRQTSDRPLLTYFRLRWAAVRSVEMPIAGEVDALLQVFAPAPLVAAANAVSTLGAITTAYTPIGPGLGTAIGNQLGGLF